MPYTPGKNYYLGMDDASRESIERSSHNLSNNMGVRG